MFITMTNAARSLNSFPAVIRGKLVTKCLLYFRPNF